MADIIQSLFLHLIESKTDVACLLDTHLDTQTEHKISLVSLGRGNFFAHSNDRKAGIVILTREAHVTEFFNQLCPSNRNLLVCSIYAPAKKPSERSDFFKLLNSHIQSTLRTLEELIIMGDFNCVESPTLGRLFESRTDPSVFDFLNLTANFDISEAFRHLFPEKREFSFVSNLGRSSRLDRAYFSNSLLNSIVNVDHPPNVFSDHSFLQVDLDLTPVICGKNSWNLPSALLEDEVYLEKVRNFWLGWKRKKTLLNLSLTGGTPGKTVSNLSLSPSNVKTPRFAANTKTPWRNA